jgi:hypothetical protein
MNIPYANKVVGKTLETYEQTLLTCPMGKEIVIKSISFANTTTYDVAVYVKWTDYSESYTQYELANAVIIYNDTVFELVSNLINLEEGDTLIARAGEGDICDVTVSYLEITK